MAMLSLLRANTPDPDLLEGDDGPDTLEGLGGNDTLRGFGGNDSLDGGDGRDRLEGGDGDDTLDASGGSAESQGFGDYIRPGLGADTILGHEAHWNTGEGADVSYGDLSGIGGLTINIGANGTGTAVSGTPGLVNDTFTYIHYFEGSQDGDLINGSDEDVWFGYAPLGGADTVNGGDGWDMLTYSYEADYFGGAGSGIIVNWAAGTVVDTQGDTDVVSGIEEIRGSQMDDLMDASGTSDNVEFSGEGGNDTLIGGDGANHIFSGGGNDSVDGGGGDDRIFNGSGDDTFEGGAGFDVLDHTRADGSGGITVNLSAGTVTDTHGNTDTVSGFEEIWGSNFGDLMDGTGTSGGPGLSGEGGDDTLIGGSGNDRLFDGVGNDSVDGGSGDDTIFGQGGSDTYNGGAGIDTIETDVTGLDFDVAEINLATGTQGRVGSDQGRDSLSGIENARVFGDWAWILTGDDNDNELRGDAGDDTLIGGGGRDQLVSGAGDDLIDASGGSAESQLFGDYTRPGLGQDTIQGHAGAWALGEGVTVSYGDVSGVDGMTISIGANGDGTAVSGNAGQVNDTFTYVNFIEGSQDNDLITGSDEDRFQGYAPLGGADTVHGGDGFDQLHYNFETDWFDGAGSGITVDWDAGTVIDTQGNTDTFTSIESIRGSQLSDLMDATGMTEWTQLRGEGGDDTLIGGEGDNRIRGGDGTDTAVINVNEADATISIDGSNATVESSEGFDELEDVEFIQFLDATIQLGGGQTLVGTDGPDTLTGTDGDDTLAGQGGDDSIDAGAGNDNISGSDGNDTVNGGAGNDNIGGGKDNDSISGDADNDTIGAGLGDDTADGGDGNDIVNGGGGNDRLTGGLGDDTMGASFGTDTVEGGEGNDSLGGGTGQDSLVGGAGDDSIGGGEGDDTVKGGSGNDFLAGGGRNDLIIGGVGDDTINGGDGDDTMTGGEGEDVFVFNFFKDGDADVITDFEDGVDSFRMVGVENAPGSGLAGKVAALNITDVAGGAQIDYQGHTVLIEGVAAADLTVDDFTFL